MTYSESATILETYLYNIRNAEKAPFAPPSPIELDALAAAVEIMKVAVENTEYGAFVYDRQKGIFVQIGKSVSTEQLCLNRYQEKVRNKELPSWIDLGKFKILKRTVAEVVSEWTEIAK